MQNEIVVLNITHLCEFGNGLSKFVGHFHLTKLPVYKNTFRLKPDVPHKLKPPADLVSKRLLPSVLCPAYCPIMVCYFFGPGGHQLADFFRGDLRERISLDTIVHHHGLLEFYSLTVPELEDELHELDANRVHWRNLRDSVGDWLRIRALRRHVHDDS